MGDYTSVRFEAQLTPEGVSAVFLLTRPPWASWADLPGFVEYGAVDRSDSIPYTNVAYAPRDWEHTNTLDDSRWSVCCSIKKPYDESVLEAFLDTVLPRLILHPCEVEVWDEYTQKVHYDLVLPA